MNRRPAWRWRRNSSKPCTVTRCVHGIRMARYCLDCHVALVRNTDPAREALRSIR